jgi:hypothetical protein
MHEDPTLGIHYGKPDAPAGVFMRSYGIAGGPVGGAAVPLIVKTSFARPPETATYKVQLEPASPGLGCGAAAQHHAAVSVAASPAKA